MLNFIYYPVSGILWFWHKVFGLVFGPSSGAAWALAVVFLVFTLRALLYKPFVHQVRSMRKMQEFSPEIQKLKKKYGNDKQKLAAEMQKLQSEHGVNPVSGCLPVLIQVPVFIGLFHVLREFQPYKMQNYVFDRADVVSFNDASIFGAKLGATVGQHFPVIGRFYHPTGVLPLSAYHTTVGQMLVVMIPLMIMAGLFTHITARHSVARQTEAQLANPQAAMMNKVTMYLFPIGVVVGAPFLPLAILFYWVSNNLWTMGQQRVVYNKIDQEEAEKATRKTETQRTLAPKVGQKPDPAVRQRKPGAKPIQPRTPAAGKAGSSGADKPGSSGADKPGPAGASSAAADKPGSSRADKPGTAATANPGEPEKAAASASADGSAAADTPDTAEPGAGSPNGARKISGARGVAGGRAGGSGAQRHNRPATPTRRGRKR